MANSAAHASPSPVKPEGFGDTVFPSASLQGEGAGNRRRTRHLLIFLILLVALLLRLIALGSRTLWYDEAFAVLFSEKGLDAMLYGTLTPAGHSDPVVA